MQKKPVYEEPIYDDDMLAMIEDQKTAELINALLCYTRTLENMVVELREQVNSLTPREEPKPFFDLHSDIYEEFSDYPAYVKYQYFFEQE